MINSCADRCRVLGVLVMVTQLACAPESTNEEVIRAEPIQEVWESSVGDGIMRGVLVMGPEIRTFRPCGEELELWAIPVESVERAYSEVAAEPYDPVFVEIRGRREAAPTAGFASDYPGQLRFAALMRAEPIGESLGCEEEIRGFSFKATGQEPFWHVRVLRDQIMVSTLDLPSTVFGGAAPIRLDAGWRYESTSLGPETVGFRLEVRRGPCADSMSSSVYTWIAILDVGGEVRRGCAWEGGLAPGRMGAGTG